MFVGAGALASDQRKVSMYTLPLVLSLVFTFVAVVNILPINPSSFLLHVLVLVPFCLSVALPVILPSGVPLWEVVVSLVL